MGPWDKDTFHNPDGSVTVRTAYGVQTTSKEEIERNNNRICRACVSKYTGSEFGPVVCRSCYHDPCYGGLKCQGGCGNLGTPYYYSGAVQQVETLIAEGKLKLQDKEMFLELMKRYFKDIEKAEKNAEKLVEDKRGALDKFWDKLMIDQGLLDKDGNIIHND